MGIALNTLSRLEELFNLLIREIGVLDKAQKVHGLGLVMKIVNDIWVGRGRQAEQDIRVRRQYLGQSLMTSGRGGRSLPRSMLLR